MNANLANGLWYFARFLTFGRKRFLSIPQTFNVQLYIGIVCFTTQLPFVRAIVTTAKILLSVFFAKGAIKVYCILCFLLLFYFGEFDF